MAVERVDCITGRIKEGRIIVSGSQYTRRFIQSFQACIAVCSAIEENDREVAMRYHDSRKLWIVSRGMNRTKLAIFGESAAGQKSMRLVSGGNLEFYFHIRERRDEAEVVSYRVSITNLPSNCNEIISLRYDRSEGQPGGDGWDDELQDNPKHPWSHLHINFTASHDACECRLPTGPIKPVLLLRAFDHWYRSRFTV